MKIYTKKGDLGYSNLFNKTNIPKNNFVFEVMGTIDEFSSYLGLLLSKKLFKEDIQLLTAVQRDLYQIMAYISGKKTSLSEQNKRVDLMEKKIDKESKKLSLLKNFILPQGGDLSSWFHIVRTICRRTERRVAEYSFLNEKDSDFKIIIKFFNRLADLLFVLARKYNHKKEVIA